MSFNVAYFSLMVCLDLCPCKRLSVFCTNVCGTNTLIMYPVASVSTVLVISLHIRGLYTLDRKFTWIKKDSNCVISATVKLRYLDKQDIFIARQRVESAVYTLR